MSARTQGANSAGKPLALEYIDYSVDGYGAKQEGRITLQFFCTASCRPYCATFSVSTKRGRTTKTGSAGEPLPSGRFRVSRNSGFNFFWKSTGLPYRRLSDFHDYMGNLRGFVYTAVIKNGDRLDAKTLRSIGISTVKD